MHSATIALVTIELSSHQYSTSTHKTTANKKRRGKRRFLYIANGETGGARTRDTRLKRPVLYQLSYRPKFGDNLNSIRNLRYLQGLALSLGADFVFFLTAPGILLDVFNDWRRNVSPSYLFDAKPWTSIDL